MQHQLTVVDPPAVGEALQRVVDRVLHGLMQQATHYHRLGQLPQAQGAYRTVLREQPHHADANHNLGVIALGTGDFVAALPHFQVARETQPGNWQYWISHVDALILAGQPWNAARMLEDARRNGMATAAIEEIMERLLGDPVGSSPAVSPEGNAPDPVEIVALTMLLNQERFVEMEQAAQGLTQRFERNAFGWRMRGMIRDIMRYRAQFFEAPEEKLNQARGLLTFLSNSVKSENNPYGMMLRSELESIVHSDDSYLLHEHLEDINEPVYFHTFAERASRAGLQYLGEADFGVMSVENFPEHIQGMLQSVSRDTVELEQYMDFLRNGCDPSVAAGMSEKMGVSERHYPVSSKLVSEESVPSFRL